MRMLQSKKSKTTITALLALLLTAPLTAVPVLGQEEEPEEPAARPSYFLLPIEVDTDSGAANGDAVISRLLPVNSIAIGEKWRLLNIAIVVVADAPGGRPGTPGNPEPVPGEKVFGLGDVSDAVLFTKTGAWWGAGVILGLPTASDDALGSGKWSAGPAFRLGHQPGPWLLSLLAGNLKSLAGSSGRADVNQLLVRVTVRRTFKEKWFFLYSPIITANWNAESDQRWLVPVGGGFGRHFDLNGTPLNVSLQAYSNVVRPDGAPHSVFRIGFTIPFRIPRGSAFPRDHDTDRPPKLGPRHAARVVAQARNDVSEKGSPDETPEARIPTLGPARAGARLLPDGRGGFASGRRRGARHRRRARRGRGARRRARAPGQETPLSRRHDQLVPRRAAC